MKSTDLHAQARQAWLRDEQTPRVTSSEPARQSNFEKSAIFRAIFILALLFAIVDVLQDGPVVVPTPYHFTI
ncbi:hypothetical protein AB4851_22345 [Burkholderia sp. 22PA0099]|uniref:hypothetical protein n=1 Tax=Burkholderia sp. 22PA0099 TaxID=3237372 RepID=UPI0039C21189